MPSAGVLCESSVGAMRQTVASKLNAALALLRELSRVTDPSVAAEASTLYQVGARGGLHHGSLRPRRPTPDASRQRRATSPLGCRRSDMWAA